MKKEMKKSGFTLVEIMIVVMIIGLLAALAIPNFLKARTNTLKKNAISNARQVLAAADEYAMENAVAGTNEVTVAQYNEYLKGGTNALNIGKVTPTLNPINPSSDTSVTNVAAEMYPSFF